MQIKLTQNCYVDGEPRKKGDVIDTKGAWLLIGCGKAEEYHEPKAKKAPANRMAEVEETR